MAVYLSKVNLKCGNYNLTGYAAFFNLVQTPELLIPHYLAPLLSILSWSIGFHIKFSD